jgi:hypothetical protein
MSRDQKALKVKTPLKDRHQHYLPRGSISEISNANNQKTYLDDLLGWNQLVYEKL